MTSFMTQLNRLFRIIDKGDATLNVPVYNGGLFLSEPAETDDSPEADAARFLNQTKVPDRFLAQAIDLLARDEDRKRHDLVFIDFNLSYVAPAFVSMPCESPLRERGCISMSRNILKGKTKIPRRTITDLDVSAFNVRLRKTISVGLPLRPYPRGISASSR